MVVVVVVDAVGVVVVIVVGILVLGHLTRQTHNTATSQQIHQAMHSIGKSI